MRTLLVRAGTLAVAFAAVASLSAQDGLDPFKKLHGELTSAKEPWQTIPWHLSILDARAEAAKEKKPVYLLARAGHPLGCV